MRIHCKQQGFALVTVLLVLLVLAMVVAALLSNQNLAVRETTDVLTAATRAQNAHNLHRVCLKQVRQQMAKNNSTPVDWSHPFNISTFDATGVRLHNVNGMCQVEAGETANLAAWTPHVRISSTFDAQTEISDWRYAPCMDASPACLTSTLPWTIKKLNDNQAVTVRAQYLLDAPVQTAWRIK